jgi:hypothetical protein
MLSNSRKRAFALLRLLYYLLANLVCVQTNFFDDGDLFEIFPEVENSETVIEEGSTLTLTCIQELKPFFNEIEIEWKFERKNETVQITII